MTKESKVEDAGTETVSKSVGKRVTEMTSLSPEIIAAIGAAVKVAMEIAKPAEPVAFAPVNRAVATPYVGGTRGIPVEEGQDLRDVKPEVMRQWFTDLENRWKRQYGARTGSSLTLTRG